MRRIVTAIDIAAPPAAVWAVLSDFAAYPDWNPFIRRIVGVPRTGAQLDVTVKPPNGSEMSFKPTVLKAEPDRELRWLGRVLIPGVFDGEHSFLIEPTATGCRVAHEEFFWGLLVPFFGRMLDDTEKGFVAANEALKRRVEAR
jgi:hypothetical protein